MRHTSNALWLALGLGLGGLLTAARAEENPSEAPATKAAPTVKATNARETGDELSRYSSRRNWSDKTARTADAAEPKMFQADEARPLVPLMFGTGINADSGLAGQLTVDTWGLHPGTPVPTPVTRWGVLIDDYVVPVTAEEEIDEKSDSTASELLGNIVIEESTGLERLPKLDEGAEGQSQPELEQSETAKVILELMETLGRSVLDGTVFQKPSQADQKWLKELDAAQVSPREALVQYIRALESQHNKAACSATACSKTACSQKECTAHCEALAAGECKCLAKQECLAAGGKCAAQAKTCTAECKSACAKQSKACTAQAKTCTAQAKTCTAQCEAACAAQGGCPSLANCPLQTTCPLQAQCPAPPAPEFEVEFIDGTGHCPTDLELFVGHEPEQAQAGEDQVEQLRGASDLLDRTASMLESQDLYLRADQLRDLANQLRFDARRLRNGWMPEQLGPPPASLSPAGMPPLSLPMPIMAGPYGPSFGPVPAEYQAPQYQGPPAQAFVPPTPQPTFAPGDKDLEQEVQQLREELRRTQRLLNVRASQPPQR